MICPYCGNGAIWCENKVVYKKNHGRSYMIWLCKPCDAYVGCHNNTKEALGGLANKKLREIRQVCHEEFDAFWVRKRMTRTQGYRWMQRAMKLTPSQAHIGNFRISACKYLLRILRKYYGTKNRTPIPPF